MQPGRFPLSTFLFSSVYQLYTTDIVSLPADVTLYSVPVLVHEDDRTKTARHCTQSQFTATMKTATGIPTMKTATGIPTMKTATGIPRKKTATGIPRIKTATLIPAMKTVTHTENEHRNSHTQNEDRNLHIQSED